MSEEFPKVTAATAFQVLAFAAAFGVMYSQVATVRDDVAQMKRDNANLLSRVAEIGARTDDVSQIRATAFALQARVAVVEGTLACNTRGLR